MNIKEIFAKFKKKSTETFNLKDKDFLLILYIVIIILVNAVGSTLSSRIDLTKNDTYSLSDKSKEIVSNLNENLKIKVLFSKDLPPQHTAVQRYLMDLLQEYSFHGNKYFTYELVGGKELEKEAQDFGINPVQSQELASDQVKIRRTYMGLVFQYSDLIEKINAVSSPVGLEYTITSLIQKMSSKETGLLSLKENKKSLKLKLFLDSNLKNLPIDGINKLEENVKKASEASKEKNYGVVQFHAIDPSVENKTDEVSKAYGLQKIKWQANRTKSGKVIPAGEGVMGIVLEGEKKFEVINIGVAPSLFGNYVITGIDKFEEKINDAVARVISSNPKVGYIVGHGEADLNDERKPQSAAVIKKLLEDIYSIKAIDLTKEEIPEDFETIIINGPDKEFKEYEKYKIDQFLMKGKSALFFINSFKEMQMPGQRNMFQQQQPMVLPINTGLNILLKHYGVTVNKDIVLDKNAPKLPIGGQMLKEIYFLPLITKNGLSEDSVITKYLQGLAFIKGSSIVVDEKKLKKLKVEYENLVSSSEESWLMKGRVNFNPIMIPMGKPDEMKSHNLAVTLKGKFESFYKGKEIPEVEGEAVKGSERIKTSVKLDGTVKEGDTKIVVIGSSEIATSGFVMNSSRILEKTGRKSNVNSNGLFIRNIIDYLNGNEHIPEMKSKSLNFNPLEKTSDTERLVYKSINIAGVPIFIILIGLFIGGMLPFIFCGMTLQSVGRAAAKIVVEVRRQFKEIKGLFEGKAKPDYEKCVLIVTAAAQKEMVMPSLLAILAPIIIGLLIFTSDSLPDYLREMIR